VNILGFIRDFVKLLSLLAYLLVFLFLSSLPVLSQTRNQFSSKLQNVHFPYLLSYILKEIIKSRFPFSNGNITAS